VEDMFAIGGADAPPPTKYIDIEAGFKSAER
jgi:hypothetical protein